MFSRCVEKETHTQYRWHMVRVCRSLSLAQMCSRVPGTYSSVQHLISLDVLNFLAALPFHLLKDNLGGGFSSSIYFVLSFSCTYKHQEIMLILLSKHSQNISTPHPPPYILFSGLLACMLIPKDYISLYT